MSSNENQDGPMEAVASSESQDESSNIQPGSVTNEDQGNATPGSVEKIEMKDVTEIEFIDPTAEEDTGEGEAATTEEAALVPEKLAEDVMKPPLWRRMLYRIFPKLERSESLWHVHYACRDNYFHVATLQLS